MHALQPVVVCDIYTVRTRYWKKIRAYSNTGFTNIIKVKGGYQARMQVPGDGRGGTKKRKQCSLPGIFDEAEDAAVWLASYKKAKKEAGEAPSSPPKQDKEHKPRSHEEAAAAANCTAAG